jgi:chitinase
MMRRLVSAIFFCAIICKGIAQNPPVIIAYYAGGANRVDSFEVEKLTHMIYSFCHLKGNRLNVDDAGDTLTIQKMVKLKARNPKLKILLSLGGWGGCKMCSEVFSTAAGRDEFSASVKELTDYFKTDGIDLDWEYPAISGYPGHRFVPEDKQNFTALCISLRKALGNKHEISFAAGGFTTFLKESIEWDKVMPVINYANLMTYDLVHGYSTTTGHHTPLYSTSMQKESTDNAIRMLDSIGVPRNKMVIGAAFYARIFENAANVNNGLYQTTKFRNGVPHRNWGSAFSPDSGFVYHWDKEAQAPYMYNASKKWFVTFDDTASMRLKMEYTIDKKLHGIMFWQLNEDKLRDGLLNVLYTTRQKYFRKK